MTKTDSEIHLDVEIPTECEGLRLDQALAQILPDYSRNRIQAWIKAGQVLLNNRPSRSRDRVQSGDQICLTPTVTVIQNDRPQSIPLQIVYEDDQLLIINKTAGLVVHPAAGNPDGTLLNALLHHEPGLEALPRAGIIHRLDKETSGLMVIAKTPFAHRILVDELAKRTISRHYLALAQGRLIAGGDINQPIGRHPRDRKRMAVVSNGKPAVTHYRVNERFVGHTLLDVQLETGRTHQIRVHFAHLGHPLVGDPVYGGRLKMPKGLMESTRNAIRHFHRQALHAYRLSLTHPATGEYCTWQASIPEDLATLLDVLRADPGTQP